MRLSLTTLVCVAVLSAPNALRAQISQSVPPRAPANLAALVRTEVKLQPPQQLDGAEISPLRATGGPQLGDAMVCLKTAVDGRTALIAVFFENGKVLNYRRAVAYDHCAEAVYAQLAAAPAKLTHTKGKAPAAPAAKRVAKPANLFD